MERAFLCPPSTTTYVVGKGPQWQTVRSEFPNSGRHEPLRAFVVSDKGVGEMKVLEVEAELVTLSLTEADCRDLAWLLEQALVRVVSADEAAMIQWAEAAQCVFELCARLGRVLFGT